MRNLILAIESSSEAARRDGVCLVEHHSSQRPKIAVGAANDGRARTRVLRRVVLRETLVLKHVQQRCLTGVVQAKKQDLGIFVGQACRVLSNPLQEKACFRRAVSAQQQSAHVAHRDS